MSIETVSIRSAPVLETENGEQASAGVLPVRPGPPAPDSSRDPSPRGHTPARLLRGLLMAAVPVVLLGVAAVVAWWLFATAPQQETTPAQPLVPTVEVISLAPGTAPISVRGFGEVAPAREVSVAPEITGRIINLGDGVEPGGVVRAGAMLFEIDPADYNVAVAQAEADLAQAEADQQLEQGRALVAQREWERFRDTLEGVDDATRSSALANREPQLAQARARVEQAKAALALAKLNHDRTIVSATFRATVLEESVERGLRVDPSRTVMRLAGVDTFWVTASVPSSQGRRLSTPLGDTAEPIEVDVIVADGVGGSTSRKGRLVRVLPGVDPAGRMTRLLVAIDDPLGLDSGTAPIRLGDYAELRIEADVLEGVVEVPREAIRENGQVWLLTEANTLRVAPVEVRWRNESSVIVTYDFQPGERLIVSFLNDPVPGQALRVREAS